jgi:hypothetical protein
VGFDKKFESSVTEFLGFDLSLGHLREEFCMLNRKDTIRKSLADPGWKDNLSGEVVVFENSWTIAIGIASSKILIGSSSS